jgi:hypothetical protein
MGQRSIRLTAVVVPAYGAIRDHLVALVALVALVEMRIAMARRVAMDRIQFANSDHLQQVHHLLIQSLVLLLTTAAVAVVDLEEMIPEAQHFLVSWVAVAVVGAEQTIGLH